MLSQQCNMKEFKEGESLVNSLSLVVGLVAKKCYGMYSVLLALEYIDCRVILYNYSTCVLCSIYLKKLPSQIFLEMNY